jgi:hypothetical protein
MNLTDLQKEVNKDIDDNLSNAEIQGWLNRALDDLSAIAKYKKFVSIQLIMGQSDYELPADLIEIVLILKDKKLNQIPLSDLSSDGYKKWGSTLTIQPTPEEDGEIKLYYHGKLPHLVNNEDIPAIPEHYHDLLVLYAVAKAKYQDEEESMQHNAMQEYLAIKQQFMIEVLQEQEPFQIKLRDPFVGDDYEY